MLFYSLTPDGLGDPASLHGGCTVRGSEAKWVANQWVWNQPVNGPTARGPADDVGQAPLIPAEPPPEATLGEAHASPSRGALEEEEQDRIGL